MSAPITNNVSGRRQVTCETSNNELVAVDVEDLRCSRTFSKICKEHGEFPSVFSVRDISSQVFKKVIDWCREHRGLPDPVIEKDAFTQEVKWLDLTPYEQQFLDTPVPELFELIAAANLLDIRSLYHSACQAIAALIKGKSPEKVRFLLRQRSDLSKDDIQEIFGGNPRLEECHERRVHIHDGSPWFDEVNIEEAIQIPTKVLVTIFKKLPRADIERLQLVSTLFCDVILSNQKPHRRLSEERGPLRPVDLSLDEAHRAGRGVHGLAENLKFCTVRKLQLCYREKISDKDVEALIPLKRAWKDANLITPLHCFSSDEQFRFAFTEVFFCKTIQLRRSVEGGFALQAFLRLPAMRQCSVLDLGFGIGLLKASEIVKWLEGDAPKHLLIFEHAIFGGYSVLIQSLKTGFLDADRPHPYKVSIYHNGARHRTQPLWNDTTDEQLDIHTEGDNDLIVERK